MKEVKLNQKVLDLWHELRTHLDALEQDVNKNARGISAAGVRTRKGLRDLRKKIVELSKVSLEQEHAKKSSK